ncbi:MAG: coproporphyrinogen III oxidase family protein [Acidobacteriota bacterium]|nr:coproporphyrinogen III oxidase family protein [Acidobacteriota bacterium]MDH3786276.1 coproporphyrinogen III oxidase family protein [Acidobacteriota bacterium]
MSEGRNIEPSATPEPVAGNYFVSAYPPFSCWQPDQTDRFLQTLETPATPDPFGLYVHIPFCIHRCRYCYYMAHDGRLQEMGDYLSAVEHEFSSYMSKPAMDGRPLSFVYFGGGTPSLLSLSQLERLFGNLQATAPWDAVEEATFECAPRSVTEEKLRFLRAAGITRLSLGVQQLDDTVLRDNDRSHGVDDVLRAYDRVQRVGFDVVNLDLIVGLVGETEQSFFDSLSRIIDLAPDSVTIYQLEIPFNTPLFRSLREDSLESVPADWATKRDRLKRAFVALEQAGYSITTAYSAVRDREKCRFVYQDAQYRGTDLLGIGVSSFSYLGGMHQQNETRLTSYVEALNAGQLPLGRAYELNAAEKWLREFVLQLKLGTVDTAGLCAKYGIDAPDRLSTTLERFRAKGWLTVHADRIALTRAGLLRVDRMIPEFYLPQHRTGRYS